MSPIWWQLPGPARFIAQINDSLHAGKNVVLCLPEHVPNGLARAVVLSPYPPHGGDWIIRRVPVDSKRDPAELLFHAFAPEIPGSALRNAATLAEAPGFARKLIWIDGLTCATWPVWRHFLEEYEHACRSYLPHERTLFCVRLVGAAANNPPQVAASLALHRWAGVVDLLDMLVYTSTIMPERALVGVKRRVAIAMVAQLALWDPAISDLLVRLSLRELTQPYEILNAIAHNRGWDATNPSLDTWHEGKLCFFEGQERLHSAAIGCRNQKNEIERRIWSGQMSILFPFIEERRQTLLNELRAFLKTPFRTREGNWIDDIRDLEIGHIEWQLVEHRRSGRYHPQLDAILPTIKALKGLFPTFVP